MKAALITNYWKNSDGGGIKTYLVNLVDAMKDKGVDVSVLFRWGDDPESFCGGRNRIAFCFRCYMQLKEIRPDVIYSQGTWYCLLPGVLYKQFHGCKLVHTFHTEPDRKLSLPMKVFFQNLLNACNCVTFVSKKLQERVIEVDGFSFSETAITYAGVRVGVVLDMEVKEFREQYGIEKDTVIILAQAMTAHYLKTEGLKILIHAVSILRETYPNILLIATREGKYSDELKLFAHKVGIEKQVLFTGDVENPFVPLKICDIYTHISLGEGLPLALLEAMSMGKPIIATPVGGIPEVIKNNWNGILVKTDAEIIANTIDIALENRELRNFLGYNAYIDSKEYTWEKCAKNFINLYEREGNN